MKEISTQSLQPVRMRASAVSDSNDAQRIDSTAAGKSLPPLLNDAQKSRQVERIVDKGVELQARLEAAVSQINAYTQSLQRNIEFTLDKASGRTVITVVDRQTHQVIRQIPDDVVLDLARNLKQSSHEAFSERRESAQSLGIVNIRA